ncbi:unnamed protein product, partial [Porites evermanni]
DDDECLKTPPVCDDNAICNNTLGSYRCSCKAGFRGDGKTCQDINECTTNARNCDANAFCNNTEGSYNCTCSPGYTGNGTLCADINECNSNVHNCDVNAFCNNTEGSYNCTCSPGFNGNGTLCTVDRCQLNFCLRSSCSHQSVSRCLEPVMKNSPFDFDLLRETFLIWNHTDMDECSGGNHTCDRDRATCTNTIGSYKCACKDGYDRDGETCIAPECKNYTTLDQGSRKATSSAGTFCDSILSGWHRFSGSAGKKMVTCCVEENKCSKHPGWLNGTHPTVAQGKVTRRACFRKTSNCCQWSMNIKVRNCGDYFVYLLNGTPQSRCILQYCTR